MNITLAQHNLALENEHTLNRSTHRIMTSLTALTALAAFEVFNYSTTAFALQSMFGNLSAGRMNLASLFALAICCMDIAGIICLFLPTTDMALPRHDRRLFGAWILAAGLNTWLTWRGISLAIAIRQAQIGWVVDVGVLTRTLPVFTAALIWLIRVLIIGSVSRPKTAIPEPDFNLGESRGFREASGMQSAISFIMPPHEEISPFDRLIQPIRVDPVKREPTYRGIPVRYKTF
jgi:hypothetical protein